jgi:hypothetical protein
MYALAVPAYAGFALFACGMSAIERSLLGECNVLASKHGPLFQPFLTLAKPNN